ncbi:hypothetical protein BKA69DRAFT_1125525 [Paraphysoderma sedebokerense]|nr:hypothetical protein BKA69DRAFT_1125525 [Paraphysoderma sedebokerense]
MISVSPYSSSCSSGAEAETPNELAHFSSLPGEIICDIASYLCFADIISLSNTSERTRFILFNAPELFRTIDFRFPYTQFQKIEQKTQFLTPPSSVVLSYLNRFPPTILKSTRSLVLSFSRSLHVNSPKKPLPFQLTQWRPPYLQSQWKNGEVPNLASHSPKTVQNSKSYYDLDVCLFSIFKFFQNLVNVRIFCDGLDLEASSPLNEDMELASKKFEWIADYSGYLKGKKGSGYLILADSLRFVATQISMSFLQPALNALAENSKNVLWKGKQREMLGTVVPKETGQSYLSLTSLELLYDDPTITFDSPQMAALISSLSPSARSSFEFNFKQCSNCQMNYWSSTYSSSSFSTSSTAKVGQNDAAMPNTCWTNAPKRLFYSCSSCSRLPRMCSSCDPFEKCYSDSCQRIHCRECIFLGRSVKRMSRFCASEIHEEGGGSCVCTGCVDTVMGEEDSIVYGSDYYIQEDGNEVMAKDKDTNVTVYKKKKKSNVCVGCGNRMN